MVKKKNINSGRNIPKEIAAYGAFAGFVGTIGGLITNEFGLDSVSTTSYVLGALGYLTFLGTYLVSNRAHENKRNINENLELIINE